MVNVEADALAGPLLAEEARAKGVVYSLAYGDQPALTCELVDWARACGFEVVAAGKGTKYLPAYHAVTPDDVWAHYGLTPDEAKRGGMNPQMFNSFLDGTKSAIEMAAIANASGLGVPRDGLGFPPCGVDDLPQILRGQPAGGVLERDGMVEVVSSLERDGRSVFRDLRWGVYVVLKAPNDDGQQPFSRIRPQDRCERLVRGDVQAVSPDRAGTRHLGAVGGAARRADRSALGVARRTRRRRRCWVAARRRNPRWRGRLYGAGKLVPAERSLAEGRLCRSASRIWRRSGADVAAGEDRALGRYHWSSTARAGCASAATWSTALRRSPLSPRNRCR